MKKYFQVIGIICCMHCNINAQILKPIPMYKSANLQLKEFVPPFNKYTVDFNNAAVYSTMQCIFHYSDELPKGAIFCRMENAIYNKLNFWVKLRMGTDERYSN